MSTTCRLAACLATVWASATLGTAAPQSATVVSFPGAGEFFQNTTVGRNGDVAIVPTTDGFLHSFSLATGRLLDPDGLALPAPATASDAHFFANARVAIPGWFPGQSVLIADTSDPTDLAVAGIVPFPATTNIQGQNIAVHPAGDIGFVAGFPDDRLYSFSASALALLHPGGLPLPGNPDRIALAGGRVAMVDTTNGAIMVVDVSDPAAMTCVGTIALPGAPAFGSNDDIVVAADGRTCFVSSNQRVVYSFDVLTMAVLDPDGLAIGAAPGSGADIALHGDMLACIWGRGLSFVDASDPTALALIADAAFVGTVATQGSATVAFSADGSRAAVGVVFPANQISAFDTQTGALTAGPFALSNQPNFTDALGATNRLAVLLSGAGPDTAWLIDGLLGAPEIGTYCTAKANSCAALPALAWTGIPSSTAAQGFVVMGDGAREGKAGILLHGPNGPAALPFQGGTLCVAPQGLRRSPALFASGGTPGPACDAAFALDLNAFATGHAGGNPQPFLTTPGQRVHCQWWGRDTPAHGSYLSDGLQYLVAP